MGAFWGEAIKQAVNVGLTGVLLVVLLKYLLTQFDRRLAAVENGLQEHESKVQSKFQTLGESVQDRLSLMNTRWDSHIQQILPLGIAVEHARDVIQIGLDRDMYRILDYINSDLLWQAAGQEEEVLERLLADRIEEVLTSTRAFFKCYRTSKGTLDTPLREHLPLSNGLGENKAGDRIFRHIATTFVRHLRDEALSTQAKMSRIGQEARERREQSRQLMLSWLEGVPAIALSSVPGPSEGAQGAKSS